MKRSLACLLWVLFAACVGNAQAAPPNVLYLVSDDQAWTDYGFQGHPHIATPHLDRLAARSAVFTRGYVPTGLCRPSLVTLVTGLYAHQHKITGNDPRVIEGQKDTPAYKANRERLTAYYDGWPSVPKLLGERGYVSHQSGKWWEGSFRRGGFTHGMTRGFPEKGGRHGDDGLTIGRQGLAPVVEYLERATAEKKPFLVWYAPMLPHSPHTPPERLFAKYRALVDSPHVARYYAMCEWFDETCGELLNTLDRLGQTQNTLVVYVGDNGWIQDPKSPNFAPRSKQSPFEGGVRQPIMLSWPGVIPPARRPELVSSIDIVPTVLAATGLPAPANLPGLNLLPVVKNEAKLDRDAIFGEAFSHDVADLDDPQASLLFRWIIEDKWKLVLTYDGQPGRTAALHGNQEVRPQLFDLLADPHEKTNLAAANPEVVARLADRLSGWWPVPKRKTVDRWSDPK